MGSIPHFLSGKVLFVTGATSFLAKPLVEKILRFAPEVGQIYMLIRPRTRSGGQRISERDRLERELFQSSAFVKLREKLGADFDAVMAQKVTAVAGDLTGDRLGIPPDLYGRLAREVDVVINIAATVVFDEPLDRALEVNTLGPARVVEFAQACEDAIFVHVSTAYVSGQQTGRIPEAPLPPDRTVADLMGNGKPAGFDLEAEIASIQAFVSEVEAASHRRELQEEFLRMLGRQDRGKRVTAYRREHQLEALRLRWIKKELVDEGVRRARRLGWHDSYTLTKAMGEQMIASVRGDLPTAIVRPSIIESSLQDPEPGWLEDLKVADPLIAHYSKGRLPDFPVDPDIVLDIVPVDIVANAVIAVLPKVREAQEIRVYHVATGSQNPIRTREVFELVYDYFRRHPMQDRDGTPIRVRRWKFPSLKRFRRRFRLKYQMPLRLLKWAMFNLPFLPWPSRLRRRVSVMEATLERVLSLCEIYSAYTHLDCEFETENIRRLFQEMDAGDRQVFNLDVTRIDWRAYIQDIHIPGLKRHVLREGNAALPSAPVASPKVSRQVGAD